MLLRDRSALEDIDLTCSEIMMFTADLTYEAFIEDRRNFRSVERGLIVIGEAVRRLSPEFRERHQHIRWRSIVGMRNFLVHDYDDVTVSEVWRVAIVDVPILSKQVNRILAEG